MASSNSKDKDVKKEIVKIDLIPKKKKISSNIKKKDIEKIIERKKFELAKIKDFKKKVELSLISEQRKISELEGAIIALFELVTGEKVED